MTTILMGFLAIERSLVGRRDLPPSPVRADAASLEGGAHRAGDRRLVVQLDLRSGVGLADDPLEHAEEERPRLREERSGRDDPGLRPLELEPADEVRGE